MTVNAAPELTLSAETTEMLALRDTFRRPGASKLTVLDGELIVWFEQVEAKLLSEGLPADQLTEFARAVGTKNPMRVDEVREAFPGTSERFDRLVYAATFTERRALAHARVRASFPA